MLMCFVVFWISVISGLRLIIVLGGIFSVRILMLLFEFCRNGVWVVRLCC